MVAPSEGAASSTTLRPCRCAISITAGMSAGRPIWLTGSIAVVRGVIAASTSAGVEVVGARVDVDEHRRGTGVPDRVGGRDEAERRADHLVARTARPAASRARCRAVVAAADGDGVAGADVRRPRDARTRRCAVRSSASRTGRRRLRLRPPPRRGSVVRSGSSLASVRCAAATAGRRIDGAGKSGSALVLPERTAPVASLVEVIGSATGQAMFRSGSAKWKVRSLGWCVEGACTCTAPPRPRRGRRSRAHSWAGSAADVLVARGEDDASQRPNVCDPSSRSTTTS